MYPQTQAKSFSKWYLHTVSIMALMIAFAFTATAQVTTASLAGRITDNQGQPLAGVMVEAEHQPSGTKYSATTNDAGRYTIRWYASAAYLVRHIGGFADRPAATFTLLGTTERSASMSIDLRRGHGSGR